MKQRYFIRELALKDLEDIWLYTRSTVDVIGIPHQSMDIAGHLTE